MLARGEEVPLLVGAQEEGLGVETVAFSSDRVAQSTRSPVFPGQRDGARVLTVNGHALDRRAPRRSPNHSEPHRARGDPQRRVVGREHGRPPRLAAKDGGREVKRVKGP